MLLLAASTAVLWFENRRWAANLDELRHLEMQERTALDNALGAIDQITLAAIASRRNPSEIPLYTGSPAPFSIRLHSRKPRRALALKTMNGSRSSLRHSDAPALSLDSR